MAQQPLPMAQNKRQQQATDVRQQDEEEKKGRRKTPRLALLAVGNSTRRVLRKRRALRRRAEGRRRAPREAGSILAESRPVARSLHSLAIPAHPTRPRE